MTYIDIHCHLEMIEKEGIGAEKAVERAKKKNVKIVWAGIKPETNKRIIKEYGKYENIYACPGLYPIDALSLSDREINDEMEFIEKNKDKIIAIGEVGLDFKEDLKEHKRQEEIFRKIIRMAKEINKPIVVHSRKAEERCIEILEEEKAKKVIMHCFSGGLKLVNRIIENEWLLSIPTSVKNSEHFQKIIEMTPIEQLLCETDSPYLHPDKKFPNLPENVVVSYEKIAEIKHISLKEVEREVEGNFEKLVR
jgi:TatD DNase family protein